MPNPTEDLNNALNSLIDERIDAKLREYAPDVHTDGTISGLATEDLPLSVDHLVREIHRLDERIDDVGTGLASAAAVAQGAASPGPADLVGRLHGELQQKASQLAAAAKRSLSG